VNKFFAVALVLAFVGVVQAGEGSLSGSVKYDGEAPKPKKHNIAAEKSAGCPHGEQEDESLVVDPATKGIKWAIIRIMDVKAATEAEVKTVEIDQKGCKFTPRVSIVAPGSDIDVLNPDKLPHNVHTIPLDGTNVPINRMMTANDPKLTVKGKKHNVEPELVQLQCDIHPWMKGFIVVHDPRFAFVTGADGKFNIKGVPPGKYKVLINHDLGEQEKQIEIKDGAATDLGDILFKQK
jgi:plastocyanin